MLFISSFYYIPYLKITTRWGKNLFILWVIFIQILSHPTLPEPVKIRTKHRIFKIFTNFKYNKLKGEGGIWIRLENINLITYIIVKIASNREKRVKILLKMAKKIYIVLKSFRKHKKTTKIVQKFSKITLRFPNKLYWSNF